MSIFKLVSASSLSLCLLGLATTGCGVNSSLLPASEHLTTLRGTIHGGPQAVVGATVSYYATTSNGYGAPGTLLSTAVTGSDGSFTFVAPAACTAGQQGYVTAYGGNPGSGANPNYLLMAALGPCSTLSSATSIWIDEVTTAAAAYSLRPFTTITNVNGVPTVNISAPANNNAGIGSCALVGNATTTCAAAGLSHAFANALNLANSVSLNGVAPTGTAYAVTPSNQSGVVPQALLNSLANSVESCVNSAGGAAGDATNCGRLFTYTTTPVGTPNVPTNTLQALLNLAQFPALTAANVANLFALQSSVSFYLPALTSAPVDYSMAIVYTGVTVPGTIGSIAVTAAGTGYTSVPAVTFTGGGTPTTPAAANASLGVSTLAFTPNTTTTCVTPVVKFTSVAGSVVSSATATATATGGVITSVVLNTSGYGYTAPPTVTFTGTGCASGTLTPSLGVVAIALTNSGAGYSSAPTVTVTGGGGTGTTATANYAVTSFVAPYALALDANDTVYVGSQNALGTSGATGFVSGMGSNGSSLFTNTPSQTYTAPRGMAADTLGHVWVASNNTTIVEELTAATGALVSTFTTGTAPFGLAIDRQNNIWYGAPASATQDLFELQQSAAYAPVAFVTKPAFTNAVRSIAVGANQNIYVSGFSATTNVAGVFGNTGTAAAPAYNNAVVQATLTGNSAPGVALDAASNMWIPSATVGLYAVAPTFTGTTVTGLTPNAPININVTTPNYDAVDGIGSIWVPNNTAGTQNITQYMQTTATAVPLSPCYSAGATTCSATSLSQPQRTQVDSTGSVWITSLSNGRIYQLLGTGAPTWPQLSQGAPGVMPQ